MAYETPQLIDPAEAHFRGNMLLAAPVDLIWGFGSALVAIGPIITVLLLRLGANNLLIALAPAMQTAGYTLLQLPAVHLTRRLRVKKYVFVSFHTCALAWSLGGLLILRWGTSRPGLLIWVLPLVVGVFSAGLSAAIALWTQLLPRWFPDRRRGLASSILSCAAAVGGITGGLVASWGLAHWAFPRNFAYLLIAAGIIMLLSVLPYLFTHETAPEGEGEGTDQPLGGMVRAVWREDRRLRRLVAVRYAMEFGSAGTAFLAVYALKRWALPDSAAGLFAVALSLGGALGALVVGRIGDRRGWRRGMGSGIVAVTAALALILAAERVEVVYGVFFLVGLAGAVDWMCYVNLLIEMSDDERRGYYQALAASTTLPPRLVGPFFWGWLGDRVGLPPVFAACLVLTAVALVLLVALVDDPRRPGQRVLRRGLQPPWFTWK